MPRKPCLPASSQTPRSTILSFSHWSWKGATWRSRKARYESLKSSCSGSKRVRSYLMTPMDDLRSRSGICRRPYTSQPDGWYPRYRAGDHRLAFMTRPPSSLTHWGAFTADVQAGDIAAATPFAGDADPSPLLGNLPGSIRHRSRVAAPAVRRGWLE